MPARLQEGDLVILLPVGNAEISFAKATSCCLMKFRVASSLISAGRLVKLGRAVADESLGLVRRGASGSLKSGLDRCDLSLRYRHVERVQRDRHECIEHPVCDVGDGIAVPGPSDDRLEGDRPCTP
jgi:hypothetical protein